MHTDPQNVHKGLSFWVAFLSGRLAAFLCRLFGYPGTSFPGVVALKICPHLLSVLAPAYEKVIAVTGTNGKTTTANIIAHILQEAGHTVAHNSEGANMLPGATSALMHDCSLLGRPRGQLAVIEVDEGSVGKVFSEVIPDLIVVTNYFRDQLDRYWELERTIGLLKEAVSHLPDVKLLLNSDDPLVASIGYGRKNVFYYGVNDGVNDKTLSRDFESEREGGSCSYVSSMAVPSGKDAPGALMKTLNGFVAGKGIEKIFGETREGRFCFQCGSPLCYRCYYYGQLGDYACPGCGFSRPAPHFMASSVRERDGWLRFALSFTDENNERLAEKDRSQENFSCCLQAPLRGFYNTYNILAAAAAALSIGVPLPDVQEAVVGYQPVTGRMEDFELAKRRCSLALIKNPVGANQVLKVVAKSNTSKALIIAINDLAADGRDVSWLWDAEFAMLNEPSVKKVICSGSRGSDMALCLKYSGFDPARLEACKDLEESIKLLALQDADEYYILATYTNLFPCAAILRKLTEEGKVSASENLSSVS